MADNSNKKFLVGIFNDENVLLKAVKQLKAKSVKIHDVYTPYPVHNLDIYLGYKRSRLSKAAFLFGATGTTLAILMQVYMLSIDWPMIVGGKNFVAAPTMVPVTFEFTVLCAALGMVGTFLISNGLGPGKQAFMFDPRSTDDKFVMAIEVGKNVLSETELEAALKEHGAEAVNTKEVLTKKH
ncbi:DUF3341 domain-containing protein [Eisenibacter elegans]|jgi:hypothetical protein|uniref:DUF3341 domain-containing protein n=1 Tax=Eisenibacter elegans TaxID=997 RepID=UPI000422025F|nr:DUF3341 domain-containing protein [Eisenibacter elegans]